MDSFYRWFRGIIQGKTRIALAWIFAFVLAVSAKEYPSWPGVLLCFLGAHLRFWASGYLRKDARPAVGGPYAFVRNPLYLGTYLMALGTALSIQNWILLGICSVTFAVVYHFIILDEEDKLARLFEGSYKTYCKQVPRFFPNVFRLGLSLFSKKPDQVLHQVNPDPNSHRFSLELAMENRAYEAYASFLGLLFFVSAMAYCWRH